MDVNQIYTGDSSHTSIRGPFPASSNNRRIFQIPEVDSETESTFDVQKCFQVGFQSYSQYDPFFQDQTYTDTNTQGEAPVISYPPTSGRSLNKDSKRRKSKNHPSLRGLLVAEAMRRRQLGWELRRDSGVALNYPNGNHMVPAAIPMDLAMRMEHGTPPPEPFQIDEPVLKTQNTTLSVKTDRQTLGTQSIQADSNFQIPEIQNTDLSINTDRQRSNSRRTGLKGNHILDSFAPTSNLTQNRKLQYSKESDIDATALMLKEIEDKDEETQKKILEGHLDKIFKIVLPPLSGGPEREVQVIGRSGTTDKMHSARFGDAEAEEEIKELPRGGNLWEKTSGRVRGWWGKSRARP